MAVSLTSRPRGAYTAARSDPSGRVVVRDYHVDRLVSGFWSIFHDQIDIKKKDEVLNTVQKSVEVELDKYLDPTQMLLVLAYWENSSLQVFSVTVPIPPTRQVIDKVIIGGGSGRSNPTTKDSKWINQRKPLEVIKNELKATELVLVQEDADDLLLLEGLTSNFFVLLNDEKTLMTTSPDLVLNGTTRRIVIKTAIELGYAVVERCPKWSERSQWKGAFLTSVSKPLCPIGQLELYATSEEERVTVHLDTEQRHLASLFAAIDEALLHSQIIQAPL